MPDITSILILLIAFGAGYLVGMVHGCPVDDGEGWNG